MATYHYHMKTRNILLCIAYLATSASAYLPISLTTQSKIKQTSPNELYQFLASPSNWPKIVASSHSVESSEGINLQRPLQVGKNVDEIFGLPPILPLSVTWKCIKSIAPTKKKAGRLEFYSKKGVPGIASECRMSFDIDNNDGQAISAGGGSNLSLQMKFEPESPLAILAAPVLTLDNALALKVLLPAALESMDQALPLNKFRNLMGTLYGGAGLAHLFDCYFGGSQLLVAAGSPPFDTLSLEGQALALLWCIAGPLSFIKSRVGGKVADLGLILYGLIEVGGAGVIQFGGGQVGDLDPFVNAVVVQGIVALAWLYSSKKDKEELEVDV